MISSRYSTDANSLRLRYFAATVLVIALGIFSRMFVTDILLFDKYLGDAMYAILVYLILRVCKPRGPLRPHAFAAFSICMAIELFQLTQIPLTMRQSESVLMRLLSVALGTQFGWADVVAYGVGVAFAYVIDRFGVPKPQQNV